MIKYIEVKSDFNDCGPAWIANVKESRSGSTIYFNQMALKKGQSASGNYFDSANGNGYWISGINKRGSNRHWAGTGIINVEKDAVTELETLLQVSELDPQIYQVCENFQNQTSKNYTTLKMPKSNNLTPYITNKSRKTI